MREKYSEDDEEEYEEDFNATGEANSSPPIHQQAQKRMSQITSSSNKQNASMNKLSIPIFSPNLWKTNVNQLIELLVAC